MDAQLEPTPCTSLAGSKTWEECFTPQARLRATASEEDVRSTTLWLPRASAQPSARQRGWRAARPPRIGP
eukprot:4621757-Pyramimonas_sp.AAC.1